MIYNVYGPDNALLGAYDSPSAALIAAITYQTITGQAAHVLQEPRL
jgi:hypothetical protein